MFYHPALLPLYYFWIGSFALFFRKFSHFYHFIVYVNLLGSSDFDFKH